MYLLLAVFVTAGISASPYFVTPNEPVCDGCTVPHPTQIQWLASSRPPCFHPGQPMFEWPKMKNCTSSKELRSKILSMDDAGLVMAKQRLCFYSTIVVARFEYLCGTRWLASNVRLGHARFSRSRREKRWVRRRNPNQNVIHFQQERYIRELSEDTAVDSPVASVKATHAADQPVYYSMLAPEDSRSQNIFALDTVTGEIRLAKSLDREVLARHVLKVTAYERLDPTISASTTVVVDVLDVQDNSPVFERDSYFADIREDAPIGTTVLSVFARDLDAGENGEVEYSLGEGEGADLLSIHQKSGVIQTAKALDRETLSLIRLSVIASDRGEPPRQSSALIEVSVIDVNDNAPQFEQTSYNVTVLENSTLPAVVARLRAVDADAGLNGRVHYSIVATTSVPLTIDYSTGEVTLRERIPARSSPVSVLVRAKDGAQPALSTTATLTLHIEDINDHAPTFITSQKQLLVEESVAVGEEIGRVYAMDEDSGANGRVSYTLEGSDDFSVDPESGAIRTVKTLDRESKARYELTVWASDAGSPPLNSSTSVAVVVKDVNDNAPVFDKTEYNVTLSEETARGSRIVILRAVDLDEDARISYRIEAADRDVVRLIDLGEQGALLSLSASLSPADHLIRVNVSATDEGGLQGRCTVNIQVDDVNSAPYFIDAPLDVKIPEDSPVGFHVVVMKAEDRDREENAKLQYSIDSSHFEIDPITGLITVAGRLDREDQSSFAVTVTVSDSATPPLNASTMLEIILEDVNDNPPEFSSQNYTAEISEDIAVGTSFMQVAAQDFDAGSNAIVDYFLDDSAESVRKDWFRLDRTSGTLRVNAKLDRETMETIVLPIYAKDRGATPLKATSQITIKLLDVNDNPPRFEQASYDLWIAENAPAGSTVGTLVAADPDQGENAVMSFRIFGGADAKLFDIEVDEQQPGVVRLLSRTVFDYEAKVNKYYLEVQASSGQLSSTVPVRIHVSDVNDNRPQLRDFVLLASHFDAQPARVDVGSVPAFDPDQNATLEYHMEENALLDCDKYTGRLTLRGGGWRRNLDAQMKTCVSDGPNTVCAKCRLIYTNISPDWLREAVSVRIGQMSLDDFWDPDVFARFRQSISALAPGWREDGVHVIGVNQTAAGDIDAHLVIEHLGQLVGAWRVSERVSSEAARLTRLTQMAIRLHSDDGCDKEPCPYYQQCRQTLKYTGEMQTHQTDNFVARTLSTLNTFVCECPVGFSSTSDAPGSCNIRLDQCYSNPCHHNGTCRPLETGYRCECAKGWRGEHCDLPTTSLTCLPGYCRSGARCHLEGSEMKCAQCRYSPLDSDSRCRLRSVSFAGEGAVLLNRAPSRLEWTMEMRIATIAREGVVLFAGNKKSDFIELSIHDRVLRAEFSLGGKSKVIKFETEKSNRVNDGEWHTVRMEYYDRKLTVLLDSCDAFSALHTAGGRSCAAQAKIDLPAKCLDPTVPCHRFLDTSSAIYLGGRMGADGKLERAVSACISNFTLDGRLVDFGEEHERVGTVSEGCAARADHCGARPCANSAKCVNRWQGYNCRCPHTQHHNGECGNEMPLSSTRPLTFAEDESYAVFAHPRPYLPFSLHFEFRTSRSDVQVIVAEFDRRNVFWTMALDDGLLRVSLGSRSVLVPAPEYHTGHWTKVEVDFKPDEIVTVVDGTYTASLPVSEPSLSLALLYAGLAPSTGHPSRFEGCLREVAVDGQITSVEQQGKTRSGCIASNRCNVRDICPVDSKCHREWDRHRCECNPGFTGDTCLSACSLRGICGGEGICQPANTTRGYECQCAQGLTGVNCERAAAVKECPAGWWGQHPHCARCSCDSRAGFEQQCDRNTGECKCPRASFLSPQHRCTPCECGAGARSEQCSASGQCQCSGQATGRRCDRCGNSSQVLNPKSLKCVPIHGRCASQIEHGVSWPSTMKGAVARQSCPYQQTGLASRLCGGDGVWKDVNAWNCTYPQYSSVVAKLSSDPATLLSTLFNATRDESTVVGRNHEIARTALERVIDSEMRLREHERGHLRDDEFTAMLVESAAAVITQENPLEYLTLSRQLADYGRAVFAVHHTLPYLRPFAVFTEEIMFAVDTVADPSLPLPQFSSFIDRRPASFPDVRVRPTQLGDILYAVLPRPRCHRCSSALVFSFHNHSSPIRVEFPLREESGWRYPECVRMQHGAQSSWTTRGAALTGLNVTHAVCEFDQQGVYALLIKTDQGAVLRLSHSDTVAGPITAGVALLLCALSFVCTIFRRGIRTKFIRLAFIAFFVFNAVNLYFLHKASINQVFCPVRNALLSFTTSTPFAWLFLYTLHIYRMLADGNPKSSTGICLLFGLVTPCLLSSATFFFTNKCSLVPSQWLFWFLAVPIAMFLLLSFYASATSFLVSLHKQYDVVVVKFSLRRALLQHALLTLLTLVHTVCCLFLPLLFPHSPLSELAANTTLVVASLYIFVWSSCLRQSSPSPATLWLDDDHPEKHGALDTSGDGCHSPLLDDDFSDRGGAPASHWMPDIIPSDPYATSTPRATPRLDAQRMVETHRGSGGSGELYSAIHRTPVAAAGPTILSPAAKILQEGGGHVYGNIGTLPKFTSTADQQEDAYYTYTASRRYNSSTFNRT